MTAIHENFEIEVDGITIKGSGKVLNLGPKDLFLMRVPTGGLPCEAYEKIEKVIQQYLGEIDNNTIILMEDHADLETLSEEQMAEFGWVRSRLPRTLEEVREALEELASRLTDGSR